MGTNVLSSEDGQYLFCHRADAETSNFRSVCREIYRIRNTQNPRRRRRVDTFRRLCFFVYFHKILGFLRGHISSYTNIASSSITNGDSCYIVCAITAGAPPSSIGARSVQQWLHSQQRPSMKWHWHSRKHQQCKSNHGPKASMSKRKTRLTNLTFKLKVNSVQIELNRTLLTQLCRIN